jgi:uncharacterized protein (DUF849 family)
LRPRWRAATFTASSAWPPTLDWEKDAFSEKAYEIVTQNSFGKTARMIDIFVDEGTHVPVGQEDNLFDVGHVPFKSNAAQVEKLIRILGEFGIEVASPAEARAVLGL